MAKNCHKLYIGIGCIHFMGFLYQGLILVLLVVHCLETVALYILSNFILFMVGGLAQYWFICHSEKQKPERHFICALES